LSILRLCPCANKVSDATQYEHLYCLCLLCPLWPMMKLSNSRNYLGYELMIWNLWGIWHHYQPPLLSLSICSLFLYMLTVFMMPLCSKFLIKWWLFLWCLYAPSFWSNDDWHVLRPTIFVNMLTIFIDAHCFYICSLS
jgi:hypothetical protein